MLKKKIARHFKIIKFKNKKTKKEKKKMKIIL